MNDTERHVFIPGALSSMYLGACFRCHDTIEHHDQHALSSVRALDGRFVLIGQHLDCEPVAPCSYCTLYHAHSDDCPVNPEATYVMRPLTRRMAARIGEQS